MTGWQGGVYDGPVARESHVGWWKWKNGAEMEWVCSRNCPHPDHEEACSHLDTPAEGGSLCPQCLGDGTFDDHTSDTDNAMCPTCLGSGRLSGVNNVPREHI